MTSLCDFINPVYQKSKSQTNIDDYDLNMEVIKAEIPDALMQKLRASLSLNVKFHDLYYGLVEEKDSRSEYDFALTFQLKREGYSIQEIGNILWNYDHGKGAELTPRDIIRNYDRCDSHIPDIEDEFSSLPQELLDAIEKQKNPIFEARKTGTPLSENLDNTLRFKAVKLSKMDWRYSGLPIYKDFIYDIGITVVYGQSNTGKSFVVTDICGHIAMGRDWGEMKFKPKKRIAVLYICAEAGKSYGKRGKALCDRLGVNDLPFYVIDAAPSFIQKNKSDAIAIVEEVARLEREHNTKIGLVVVDTLATTFDGGNENSSEDMGMFVNNVKYIQRHADTGVLIVHHSGKDQKAGARGHSSLQAATDTEIEVTSEKQGVRYHRKMTVKKQREGQNGKIIEFGLKPIELDKDDDGDPIDTCHVILKTDNEFESFSINPEDTLSGSQKTVYLTIQRFRQSDMLEWCKDQTTKSIRQLMLSHKAAIKNNPQKALSLPDILALDYIGNYDAESRNFARDFDKVKHNFDKTHLTLGQWIERSIVKSSHALSPP